LSGTLPAGWQANHLNQTAAYGETIPRSDGLTVVMQGNAITDVGSPHYEFHRVMEQFLEPYRRDNERYGALPTNVQYGQAVERALIAAGFTRTQASQLAQQAAAERAAYGLDEAAKVMRIPGRINQYQR
jgi:hypothetical protein